MLFDFLRNSSQKEPEDAPNKKEKEEKAKENLDNYTSEMLSRYCRFSPSGNHCVKICAHFKEGRVWYFEPSKKYIVNEPHCKLWSD